MDWIKKRYDQFILAVVAATLLAFAILVWMKTNSLPEKFTEATAAVSQSNKIPPLVLSEVERAKTALQEPPIWVLETDYEKGPRGSLFVSQPYIIGPAGVPKKPIEDSLHTDSLTGKKIPNRWFFDHNISPLEGTAATQDPDGDGFSNEDEWRADTDPNNKASHPPYYTKLFLKQVIRVPFRLIFQSYDGTITKPETMSFQINTLDIRAPSEFLKIGEMVPKTNYKLEKFEFKERPNANTGEKEDVSELTLLNTETSEPITLVITKVTNSPDVYAVFDYQWPQPPQDIRVKKLQEFALRPETDKRYKLVDVKDTEVVIQLPDGQKYTVVRDPRKPAR